VINKGATHIPILKRLFAERDIATVLEFGMGEFSTLWLAEHAESVMSIEDNAIGWLPKTIELVKAAGLDSKWSGVCTADGHVWLARQAPRRWDMVFVDGRRNNRPDIINAAFAVTDLIVAHDTECVAYEWERVEMPDGWECTSHHELTPWTSVWRKSVARDIEA